MRPAHRAPACWVDGAVAYNVLAPDHETISEGIDELLLKYPLLTRIAIMTVTHHLMNELVPKLISRIGVRRAARATSPPCSCGR